MPSAAPCLPQPSFIYTYVMYICRHLLVYFKTRAPYAVFAPPEPAPFLRIPSLMICVCICMPRTHKQSRVESWLCLHFALYNQHTYIHLFDIPKCDALFTRLCLPAIAYQHWHSCSPKKKQSNTLNAKHERLELDKLILFLFVFLLIAYIICLCMDRRFLLFLLKLKSRTCIFDLKGSI